MAQLALALSAYHGEHQAYPVTLAKLMPKYLPEIPKDPFCDEEFHYKTENEGYLLYSVGQNGVDDGGKNYALEHLYDVVEDKSISEAEKSTDDLAIRKPSAKVKN